MTSLTPLSKKHLENLGYTVERVEHFNFFAKKRSDLLGVGDLLALNGTDLLLVQVTSRKNIAHRRNKLKESYKLKLWLKAGGKMVIHGWDKPRHRYRLKEEYYETKK